MSRVVIDSVPFFTHLASGVTHAKHILQRDRARASKLLAGLHPHGPLANSKHAHGKHHHHHRVKHVETGDHHHQSFAQAPGTNSSQSIDVTDAAVTYTCQLNVGNPPVAYDLLIDTGSSNTWVGAEKAYKPSSTSTDTRKTVQVSYGSGNFTGKEYIDQVSFNDTLVIEKQSIGVASSATGFNDVDGILGIGPVDLTSGTIGGTDLVPTVTDNLLTQKTITTESIGISYVPTTSSTAMANGELTFGDVDSSKFTGEITYVPITSKTPANKYWGIDQSVSYGGKDILTTTAGIVDTGTTLLLLATSAFKAYQEATGATLDQATGLLTVTDEQLAQMESLIFKIGDTTFEFTANAQIWPRNLNSSLGGAEGKIYLIAADIGSDLGAGLDFIDGFCFLQRFYSVYDTTNSQVGLATTEFTTATTN